MKAKIIALLCLTLFVLSACTSSSTKNPTTNSNSVTGKTVVNENSAALESNDCKTAVAALEVELSNLEAQLKETESEFIKGARRLQTSPNAEEEAKINALGDQLPELRKLIQNLAIALEDKKASCN